MYHARTLPPRNPSSSPFSTGKLLAEERARALPHAGQPGKLPRPRRRRRRSMRDPGCLEAGRAPARHRARSVGTPLLLFETVILRTCAQVCAGGFPLSHVCMYHLENRKTGEMIPLLYLKLECLLPQQERLSN